MKQKSWKTSLLGGLAGFLILLGPQGQAMIEGKPETPPITTHQMILAAAVAALGAVSKDGDQTGPTKPF